jgi:hypothetical protein
VTRKEACIILYGCWAVWTERNASWHGEGGRSITESVRWVLETIFDLAQLGKKHVGKPLKPKPQWRKPPFGSMKINVDACFQEDLHKGGRWFGDPGPRRSYC